MRKKGGKQDEHMILQEALEQSSRQSSFIYDSIIMIEVVNYENIHTI